MADLYSQFDSKVSARTAGDVYYTFAASDPLLAGVSRHLVNLAAAALDYALRADGEDVRRRPEDKGRLLLEHAEFVLWLAELLGQKGRSGNGVERGNSKHITRSPAAAAMFKTWQRAKKDATAFWLEVRDESAPEPKAPSRVLARYLRDVVLTGGRGTRQGAKVATDREVLVRCLQGWNAWRKGEPTELRYYADKPVPKVA
jgi:hypothetical protein